VTGAIVVAATAVVVMQSHAIQERAPRLPPAASGAASSFELRGRPPDRVLSFALADGEVAGGGNTVSARRGEALELRWTSTTPVMLHLHGYDLETQVMPDTVAILAFKAELPGRFPVTVHGAGAHRAVLYLDVTP